MRYSQLNYVVCPRCHGDLTSVTLLERPCEVSPVGLAPFDRVPAAGAVVGPVPRWTQREPLADILESLSGPPAAPERNYRVVVETGLLACAECGAWYPVIGCIPELLPDHLRDWSRDREWLESVSRGVPGELLRAWRDFQAEPAGTDSGAHYKLAEIGLPSKIEDPGFWGPGYASPFNVWTAEHTWHLVRNFVVAEPLLELSQWQVVLDLGSGFSWTTEWFLRSGYESIGMDICRTYLEIALARIGPNRPHLLVGDAEHLPIRSGSVRAVLAFEAFHHIPDRAAAMREVSRVLADRCPLVLVEPGSAHEHAAVSVDAMRKYGTLEKGMDLPDVETYARGSGLIECRQHHVVRSVAPLDTQVQLGRDATSLVANQIYTLRKGTERVTPPAGPARPRRMPGLRQAARWMRRTVAGALQGRPART